MNGAPASGLPSVNVSADGALPMPDFVVGGGDFRLSCTVQITDLVHEGMMLKSTTKCGGEKKVLRTFVRVP
jgi:hypothetical protein